MIYRRAIPIEFNHCDPAGIVFYPRYFEMTNSVVENFFREVADHSYAAMMTAGQGVPTAGIEAKFQAPSRLGEVLDWQLSVARLGQSSISFHLGAFCGEEARMVADMTLVFVNDKGRPNPWPRALRDRITAFMEST